MVKVRTLDRKWLRELWHMRGQALAIALVIASGVATYILSESTIDSLTYTQQDFYSSTRFAEVFANVKRAPLAVAGRIAEIPGIAHSEARVAAPVKVDVPGFPEVVNGLILTLPAAVAGIDRLYLRSGRFPKPDEDDAIVVNEAFAQAQGLHAGDSLGATINGRLKTLRITGIALSPEFVYLIRPGDFFPDYKRYGIFWMNRKPLAMAYGMDGAFNDVIATLAPDASQAAVISQLDRLLAPWGGSDAIGRDDQTSHHYLTEEINQLRVQATIMPAIFLGVAAFLLNVVVGRLIRQQRETIAILKAFGYGNRAIASHYLKLVGVIVAVGVLLGTGIGAWLAHGLSDIYSEFFRYPYMHFVLRPQVPLIASAVSAGAALLGTVDAVGRAAIMAPAQALHPEPPLAFHETLLERAGARRLLSQGGRMILRNIARRPVKSALTVLGVALACSIVTVGGLFNDAVSYMVDVQFNRSEHADLTATFTDITSPRATFELATIPDIRKAEAFRVIPVRLRNGNASHRTAIQAFPADGTLFQLRNTALQPIRVPETGLMLTDFLADRLGVRLGDPVTVEVLTGARPVLSVRLAGVVKEFAGMNAYMSLDTVDRLLPNERGVSGARLEVAGGRQAEVYSALRDRPRVAGVTSRAAAMRSFHDLMAQNILIYAAVMLFLAGTIAVGVIYNSTRIALSERAFELATLRVLGLTHREIGYILLGETGLLTLLAIPVGFAIGYGFATYMAYRLASALYRVPVVLEPATLGRAAMVIVVATVLSSAYAYVRLGRLDLVSVLKTRE